MDLKILSLNRETADVHTVVKKSRVRGSADCDE